MLCFNLLQNQTKALNLRVRRNFILILVYKLYSIQIIHSCRCNKDLLQSFVTLLLRTCTVIFNEAQLDTTTKPNLQLSQFVEIDKSIRGHRHHRHHPWSNPHQGPPHIMPPFSPLRNYRKTVHTHFYLSWGCGQCLKI